MFKHIFLAGFAACLPALAARADVTISAAVSLKPALEKAQPLLEKAAGEKVAFNFGASGTLAGQIRQGAPIDLFLAADRPTAEKLAADKAADPPTLRAIAGNTLVLISPANVTDKTHAPTSFADLPKVQKLALGDPKIVPAGTYAQQALTHLKLYDTLSKNNQLVTTGDVAQALTLVRRGEVDAGLVYASDAHNQPTVKILAIADPAWHNPIEYVSVIVTASPHKAAATKVQKALLSPDVQTILNNLGFTPPPAASSRPNSQRSDQKTM